MLDVLLSEETVLCVGHCHLLAYAWYCEFSSFPSNLLICFSQVLPYLQCVLGVHWTEPVVRLYSQHVEYLLAHHSQELVWLLLETRIS